MMDVLAYWSEDYGQYVAGERGNRWFSTDGDSWTDEDGQPLDDDRFHEASIKLIGGERDGEWVA